MIGAGGTLGRRVARLLAEGLPGVRVVPASRRGPAALGPAARAVDVRDGALARAGARRRRPRRERGRAVPLRPDARSSRVRRARAPTTSTSPRIPRSSRRCARGRARGRRGAQASRSCRAARPCRASSSSSRRASRGVRTSPSSTPGSRSDSRTRRARRSLAGLLRPIGREPRPDGGRWYESVVCGVASTGAALAFGRYPVGSPRRARAHRRLRACRSASTPASTGRVLVARLRSRRPHLVLARLGDERHRAVARAAPPRARLAAPLGAAARRAPRRGARRGTGGVIAERGRGGRGERRARRARRSAALGGARARRAAPRRRACCASSIS